MKIRLARAILALGFGTAILSLQACVEPFDVVTGQTEQMLMVDGMITDRNDTTFNNVKLSWTAPFNGVEKEVVSEPVQHAEVTLHDSQGNMIYLRESHKGNYIVDHTAYTAQPGSNYTLQIKLADGRQYATTPEMLTPAPPISELNYTYKESTVVGKNGSGVVVEKKVGGFEVNVAVNDPAETQNYYRWTTDGIFEYYTIALDIVNPPPSICWSLVGRIDKQVATYADAQVNGNKINRPVAVIPADLPTRYLATVRQFSLTPAAHEFWRLLQQQQTSVGSIFDPPPAQIRGNVYSISNPEEEVYGYFGASGLSEKSILISRAKHYPFPGQAAYEVPPSDFKMGCLLIYSNTTSSKPPGF